MGNRLARKHPRRGKPRTAQSRQPCLASRGSGRARMQARAAGRWWLSLGLGLGLLLGCIGGALLVGQGKLMPPPVARALGGDPAPAAAPVRVAAPVVLSRTRSRARQLGRGQRPPARSQCAARRAGAGRDRAGGVGARPDCDMELRTLVAPNGEPWPDHSGYLEGAPVENQGDAMQIEIDNAANASPVLVKVFDLERHASVRQIFLLPNERLTVDNLKAKQV
ncbi:hypothetical protein LP419_17455 [Massilia sp. H-1]|nr:hypothetical protein LP419_17455 [Massilia sp. H-1]